MCGIFGYIGENNPFEACIQGLELLEYRGYDSAGIAGIKGGKIAISKATGKLSNLKAKTVLNDLDLAIGHTRWATHGKVTEQNAHPHLDMEKSIALVHNGIIENCDYLKEALIKEGVVFTSETDSEIIAQLIAKHYEKDLMQAVQKTLPLIKGQFAIALIHKDHPDQIIAAARECPLSIGYDANLGESIISSDPNTFCGKSLKIVFLRNDEMAKIEKGKVSLFDRNGKAIWKKAEHIEGGYQTPSKEGYDHYLLKEIFEQPTTIQQAFSNHILDGAIHFEGLTENIKKAKAVYFIGCGTSSHAGAIGALFLEDFANIPAHSEIASEARFRIIAKDTLVIAITQSGETADTLAAVKEIRARGHRVIGICNVKNSTITRETDGCIFLKAGPEMSVCSTKAFTSQIAILYILALYMANKTGIDGLKMIPLQIQTVLSNMGEIERIAKKYSGYENFFFMGRRYMFPTCLEAALKLKELSYANAGGYAAGELKHGAIALIDENFPVVAFLSNRQTEEKMLSNLQEVKARGAPLLAFAPNSLKSAAKIADDVIWLPNASDPLSPFASTVAAQLLAYFIAKTRGCDIDQPRNLAKSVTVE